MTKVEGALLAALVSEEELGVIEANDDVDIEDVEDVIDEVVVEVLPLGSKRKAETAIMMIITATIPIKPARAIP
jgi:hypothetical protein